LVLPQTALLEAAGLTVNPDNQQKQVSQVPQHQCVTQKKEQKKNKRKDKKKNRIGLLEQQLSTGKTS
jgi:hypothetical protein